MKHHDLDDLLAQHLSDENRRRRYAQNSLVVDVAVELNRALALASRTQRELAARLGKTEGFVSQVLSGGENLTLRTLGDFAWGLDCQIEISLQPKFSFVGSCSPEKWNSPQLDTPDETSSQLSLAA